MFVVWFFVGVLALSWLFHKNREHKWAKKNNVVLVQNVLTPVQQRVKKKRADVLNRVVAFGMIMFMIWHGIDIFSYGVLWLAGGLVLLFKGVPFKKNGE